MTQCPFWGRLGIPICIPSMYLLSRAWSRTLIPLAWQLSVSSRRLARHGKDIAHIAAYTLDHARGNLDGAVDGADEDGACVHDA